MPTTWPHFSDYVQYEHRHDAVLERLQRNEFYFIFFEYPRSWKKSLNDSRSSINFNFPRTSQCHRVDLDIKPRRAFAATFPRFLKHNEITYRPARQNVEACCPRCPEYSGPPFRTTELAPTSSRHRFPPCS